ncbi:trafficking protein particle complex subunit 5 isoform X1 [Elephas maximus indicus]|uniref:trafficking protein particle complex subunit 5 isoform X1 n=1 Tax=Elephas maximus indicus TaxID=99487 RepID=UPI0021167896|nr:trafficking protein particle complex subunit 5 isoform X1 [Elephas maximus indicus]
MPGSWRPPAPVRAVRPTPGGREDSGIFAGPSARSTPGRGSRCLADPRGPGPVTAQLTDPNRISGCGGMEARFTRGKSALLERALARPRTEVSLSAFALLFSELVQHCQSRVFSVAELQARLAALGRQVGARVLDALVAREKGARRETKVLGALLFVKGAVWKALFGKEADKLEQANDDARTFYIIEREPLINTYISVPKENSTLNCASFTAGIVEAVLTHSGFPAKVTAHWHKGTTLMIKFEEAVIARDRALEGR